MKKYSLKAELAEDGRFKIISEGEGFNGLEILGILAYKQTDILRQLSGEIKPDIVKRTFVADEPEQEKPHDD